MSEIIYSKEIKNIEKEEKKEYIPIYYGEDEELIEDFSQDHKKRKLITKDILEGWKPSRNNDRLLDWECLRMEFPEIELTSGSENIIFKIPRKLIKFLPSPESYTRARRSLIQHTKNIEELKNLVPTDERVIIRRSKRERVIRDYFGSEKAREIYEGKAKHFK